MHEYYLSFVVTTRNDNHGGDLLKRTQTFLNGLIFQTNKFKLKSELIIVEWNPPSDKPFLKESLIIKNNIFLSIRFIIVPSSIQQTFRYKDTIPLYQMIAKNVGIRRAKGEFVLCTNIDLLFSSELIERLVRKELKKNEFYRANRCDIPKDVMELATFDEQLSFAKQNIIVRHGKNPRHIHITTNLPNWMYFFDSIAITIDFFAKSVKKIIWNKEQQNLHQLDFMACGDFTMMSKEDWIKIDGYVEIDLYSLHVDSMALISAKALGLKQVVFEKSECTFHIQHKEGWTGFEDPLEMIQFLIKRPSIDWYSVGNTGYHLLNVKKNWGINKSNWGYSDVQFEEFNV